MLVWLDLEMTGLDLEKDEIIEAACVITDQNLNTKAEISDIYIQQPPERYEQMDQWNQKHHKDSGLWDKVIKSQTTVTEAETILFDFIKKHAPQKSTLAGNSIWNDRRFLNKYMKKIDDYLHHRMLDVSSIKILKNFWFPGENHPKKNLHRALDDVNESIQELQFYRERIFRSHEPLQTDKN